MNPLIFRAYDIRGIADQDLTEETVKLIGQAAGTYFQKYFGKNIVIGRDNRLSGEKLQKAFIEGLRTTGCNITNIGLSTSPLVYYTTCKYNFDGGVNITASHNPKEYNGIKFVAKNAHSICGDEIQKIKKIIDKKEFKIGYGKYEEKDIFQDYIAEIKSQIHLFRPLKIAIDAGNGTAGKFAPELFRKLGCEVEELYCDLDGNFPNHLPDPEEYENIKELAAKIKSGGFDLGLAFDGDGDRIGIIDEKGKDHPADYVLIFLARDLLARHPGSKIVFDVKCSKILENDIKSRGGIPIMNKTGHSFQEQRMKKENALLAGETSGHIFMAENYYGFDDALYVGARILEILSKEEKSFSSYFLDVPRTFLTPEIKLPCGDEVKFAVMDKLVKEFCEKYHCNTIDGVRISFDSHSWAGIRCSNTTPNLTLRFEAQTPERLAEIKRIVKRELEKYEEIDSRTL